MKIEHVGPIARPAHALVRIDTGRGLDFNDVRAEITEDAATGWARPYARQVQHAKPDQCR
jgi:hypothetical protein